jgi:hypothetical protein
MKSRGLGDDIKKITSATRLDKLAERIAELTNSDCGCDRRQEKLNKLFPRKRNKQQRIMVHTNGSTRGTLSGIYDPSKSNLETRGEELFEKFGYEPISDIKKIGNLYFLVILIITDKRTMEN